MPVDAIAAELPDHPDPNFLREAMIDQLQKGEARIRFSRPTANFECQ